jgi:hypothetical protein
MITVRDTAGNTYTCETASELAAIETLISKSPVSVPNTPAPKEEENHSKKAGDSKYDVTNYAVLGRDGKPAADGYTFFNTVPNMSGKENKDIREGMKAALRKFGAIIWNGKKGAWMITAPVAKDVIANILK